MPTIILRSTDAGAPTLSGTNGTLCAVLDWALPQNGWAIEHTAANARVYRPGVGLRNRLHVRHDSAVSGNAALAVVRGCEGATSATALVDAFPTVAQVADSNANVCVSNAANTTARPYVMVVTPTFIVMAISTQSSNASFWELFVFGDAAPTFAEDAFHTLIGVGNTTTTSATSSRLMGSNVAGLPASGSLFWCRSIDGSIKSSRGNFAGSINSNTSFSEFALAARGGYMNRILREKIGAHCFGAANSSPIGLMAIPRRGWIPNLWNPLHNNCGAITADDTFADTGYNPAALFQIVPAISARWVILELSDTWSAPVA